MQSPVCVCTKHYVVSLNVLATALPDWLHVTSNSLSTWNAIVPQTGKETGAGSSRALYQREGSRCCQRCNKHHNLVIYFYDDKHAQFSHWGVKHCHRCCLTCRISSRWLVLFTIPVNVKCSFSDSDVCVFLPLCFSPYAVLMWTMARHQVAAPWTPWPARAQASSCRPILSTANGESRSSTAQTVTTTSLPSLCPETPPLPVTCECMVSCASTSAFIKHA